MKKTKKTRILTVNLNWLELFKKPTSAYELFKHSSFSSYVGKHGSYSSYAGAHKQVRSLERLGLVVLTYSGLNCKGTIKKLFVLTDKGRSFLRLFPPEALIQGEEDP